MASSISSLSYLDTSAYQSLPPVSSSANAAGASAGVSATAELQAIQQSGGGLQSFFNDSMAAALLQPASGINSGTATSTLVSNMLQQVLGAYQAQGTTSNTSGISATG